MPTQLSALVMQEMGDAPIVSLAACEVQGTPDARICSVRAASSLLSDKDTVGELYVVEYAGTVLQLRPVW